MTPSPDLIDELRAARPAAPAALRMRVHEIAAAAPAPTPLPRQLLPSRRAWMIALSAAAAFALASAGVLGLARSGEPSSTRSLAPGEKTAIGQAPSATAAPLGAAAGAGGTDRAAPTYSGAEAQSQAVPSTGRAQQVSATLTVEVRSSNAVSKAAQDALDLTRSLGGYVVNSSVSTGDEGSAAVVVRVPVAKVQDAVVGFSALGRIVSQQVATQDLQESLDSLQKTEATLRTQIARLRARLATQMPDPETEAVLRARLQTMRAQLVQTRAQIAATNDEARMATIELSITTPGTTGAVAPRSRIDRTLDEALNVLAWEGLIALGLLVAVAPLAIAGAAVWLGHRLYRRREEERLLASS
jgi:uncharacterized protein DUF4349